MATREAFEEKLKVLREKALLRLSRTQSEIIEDARPETRRLLHELNVQQIELELQNEELREAQRQLERSRDRYLQLYHQAPVGYAVVNHSGILLQANSTLGLMIGRDVADLLRKPINDLLHAEDRTIFLARFRSFFKNPAGKQIESRLLKNNGETLYAKLEGRRLDPSDQTAVQDGLSDCLLLSISDISAAKTAELSIIKAKKQWEQTFDAVSDPMAVIDDADTVVRVNMALAKRIGASPQECIGKKCYQVLHNRTKPCDNCVHRQLIGRNTIRTEVFNAKFNGHFILTVSAFTSDTGNGRPWSIHVFHDISDRKRAEKELVKVRNLESIATLAGGIAHDFNNILTVMVGHIELAKLHAGNPEKIGEHLNKSMEACQRAKDLSNRLITFSEGGSPHMHPIRICRVIEEVVALSLSGTNIRYDLDLPYDLQPMIIDEVQIKSALQNVIDNAREAMPWGGTLSISVRNTDPPSKDASAQAEGKYLRIDIRDQGIGIEPSHLDKIFDPYFTTKQMGTQKGMGLGLAITHSVIKRHKGRIDVRSQPGAGTTVSIFLPTAPGPPSRGQPDAGRNKTLAELPPKVLFMDDEREIWRVVEEIVGQMGCKAHFAADAEQALFLFRRAALEGEPYTAVILDLTIRGGIGGKEVVREMLTVDPDVKALAVSGYSSDPVFIDFRQYGFMDALKKPFGQEEFKTALVKIMQSGGQDDQKRAPQDAAVQR